MWSTQYDIGCTVHCTQYHPVSQCLWDWPAVVAWGGLHLQPRLRSSRVRQSAEPPLWNGSVLDLSSRRPPRRRSSWQTPCRTNRHQTSHPDKHTTLTVWTNKQHWQTHIHIIQGLRTLITKQHFGLGHTLWQTTNRTGVTHSDKQHIIQGSHTLTNNTSDWVTHSDKQQIGQGSHTLTNNTSYRGHTLWQTTHHTGVQHTSYIIHSDKQHIGWGTHTLTNNIAVRGRNHPHSMQQI